MNYEVSFSDSILSRLTRLKNEVRAIGKGKELGRVLTSLLLDLRQRPLEAGEVMYHLKHIPMPVISFAKEYLGVVYAVHEDSKQVMVTKLKMMERHPFPSGFEKYLNK